MTPTTGITGPKHFPHEFDDSGSNDVAVQPEVSIVKPKVVRAAPCVVRRVATNLVKSPVSSPGSSPPNSPPESPRLNGDLGEEGPWYVLDHPEISCRGLKPGPSILKHKGSINRRLTVTWPAGGDKYVVDCYACSHEESDREFRSHGPRTSNIVKDEAKAQELRERAKYNRKHRHHLEAASLARAASLECSFGNGPTNPWPVYWSKKECVIYHPPPDGVHDAALQLSQAPSNTDFTSYSRELGMQILYPTWDHHR